MNSRERILTLGLFLFILISVITIATSIYYHQEYSKTFQKYLLAQENYSSIRAAVMKVTLTIDYGNGTSVTEENIYLFNDATVLDALRAVAQVNATYWEVYQSFYIEAINDVFNNENGNNRWWVYSVNGEHALVSADHYIPNDGDQIEWIYHQY